MEKGQKRSEGVEGTNYWVQASLKYCTTQGIPSGSDGKASAYSAEDPGSIPGLGRSPGEGNGNPLQYSCLENPMDGRCGRLQSMGSQRVGHN